MKKLVYWSFAIFSFTMLEANPFRGLKYKDFSNEQQWAIKLFDLKVSTLSWAGNYEGYV